MLYIIMLVLLVAFFVFGAAMGVKNTNRLLQMDIDEASRVEHFKITSFGLWFPVIAVFLVVAFSDITFYDIGFRWPSFAYSEQHIAVTVIAYAVAILWTCYLLFKIIAFFVSPKYRAWRMRLIKKKENSDIKFELIDKVMLPRTIREKRWYAWLSFAAGFCEEVIFRGVFIFLMVRVFPDLSMHWIIAILIVLFGLGHFYQGLKGIIYTGAVGALFMFMYIAGGYSLLFVIILHFLIDFANCFKFSEDEVSL